LSTATPAAGSASTSSLLGLGHVVELAERGGVHGRHPGDHTDRRTGHPAEIGDMTQLRAPISTTSASLPPGALTSVSGTRARC
jgi:hypothetical protein